MANTVTSACCAVLAAVVVVYAQKHGLQSPRVQYEKIGSHVTLHCGILPNTSAVTWKVNGSDVEDAIREGPILSLKVVDLSHSGLYSCFDDSTDELKDQISLRTGNPPREPVVLCRSNTYPRGFYCSWHLNHPTYIPNEFEINAMHDNRKVECERDPNHKNRCHIKFDHLFSTLKYKVMVTAKNALGTSSTTLMFDEFAIVKPDPPERVEAKKVPNNPRKLEVRWHNPSTWPDPDSFPLKFFLRYRPLILDQWQHVELSDGTSHTITDAYAGKEYIIQVAAKDNEIGTWSDWSVAVHATPWMEEPKSLTTEVKTTVTFTTPAPSSTSEMCVGSNSAWKVSLSIMFLLVTIICLII
ncbi:ciliary neurotrophic factor receptor subunit alpha [Protopterus annectens]|uniref:ciliary neurotrophic factor receptor subunit alpha n=1 Tax=Protopterus annectens TaxID=7888 RepID=UPI001CF9A2F6|nr:ciliary neurotrophic factor receptor subunit alpha [Protopterus annectens]XP_043933744.1 ciliary neurotrophic factor receptor subunit alpha [Protopterus annectens]